MPIDIPEESRHFQIDFFVPVPGNLRDIEARFICLDASTRRRGCNQDRDCLRPATNLGSVVLGRSSVDEFIRPLVCGVQFILRCKPVGKSLCDIDGLVVTGVAEELAAAPTARDCEQPQLRGLAPKLNRPNMSQTLLPAYHSASLVASMGFSAPTACGRCPEADRFGDVVLRDAVARGEVGDRAGHPQDAVVGAGR